MILVLKLIRQNIEFNTDIEDGAELKTAFLTFYPTLLNLFYTEIPCKSLIQFVEDCNSKGVWPYSNEVDKAIGN